jgi:hypothetical protein
MVALAAVCGATACMAQEQKPAGTAAPYAGRRVLIATEDGAFKQAVVAQVHETVEQAGGTVTTVAIKELGLQRIGDFDAAVILSTVRAWRLPGDVRDFLKPLAPKDRGKIVLVNTAAGEDWQTKEKGVHAITSASKPAKIGPVAAFVTAKLQALLSVPSAP